MLENVSKEKSFELAIHQLDALANLIVENQHLSDDPTIAQLAEALLARQAAQLNEDVSDGDTSQQSTDHDTQQPDQSQQQASNQQNQQAANQPQQVGASQPQPVPMSSLPSNMQNNDLFKSQIVRKGKVYATEQDLVYDFITEVNEVRLNAHIRPLRNNKFTPGPNNLITPMKTSHVVEAMFNLFDISRDDDGIIYLYDTVNDKMLYEFDEFASLISRISSSHEPLSNLEVDDVDNLTRKVYALIKANKRLRKINPLPTKLTTTSNGYIIDLETKEKYPMSDVVKFYDIISISPRCYIDLDELDPKEKATAVYYRELGRRLLDQWGEKIEGLSLLLGQGLFAAIEGWNRDQFMVLKGSGGNGKSTYMELAEAMAGSDHTEFVNIHQWSDHNVINPLGPKTKLIIGDDAPTSAKLSDSGMSNLKSITTGQAISVNVKYRPNKVIRTRGLYMQGTNTDVRIFENSEAIRSRMILIDWIDTNFRSMDKSSMEFNLDLLKKDPNFLDNLYSMTVDEIEYFIQFTVPQESIDALDRMIEGEDVVQQLFKELEEELDGCVIPINYAYEKLKLKMRQENPGSSVMKLQTFTKRIVDLSKKSMKFIPSEERRRFGGSAKDKSVTCAETTRRLSGIENVDLIGLTKYLKPRNPITKEELSEFKENISTIEMFSSRQLQMLDHLMHTLKDTEVIALFNDKI